MPNAPSIEIIGVHPVEVSEKRFQDAVSECWGNGLDNVRREHAEQNMREHFEGLYLIEIRVTPPETGVEWEAINQTSNQKPGNEQVPYDERLLSESEGRWAFFFHFLDLNRPLGTQMGEIELPFPTQMPEHLAGIEYELP